MKKIVVFIATLILVILYGSCASRKIKSEMTEIKSKELSDGRIVFKENCQKCHPNGEAGVGPPLNNLHVPGFLTRARIRSRAFLLYTGRMPQFKKNEISKREMKALMTYINTMKKRNPEEAMAKK